MNEIAAAVRCYRASGFFASDTGSDEELAAELARAHAATWGDELSEVDDPGLRDVLLLAGDADRVWMEDLECDVAPGAAAYARAIAAWSRISRGALELEDVEETWEGPVGPVDVRVVTPAGVLMLSPVVKADWLDLSILAGLNAFLEEQGAPRRFASVAVDGQTALVCALGADERKRIEEERPLRFVVPA